MDVNEAIAYTLATLKAGGGRAYGYDLYPTQVVRCAAARTKPDVILENPTLAREWSPFFMEAAWELCRRGLLRPGPRVYDGQTVSEGGFSFTEEGRRRLPLLDDTEVLLVQPGALASTFESHRPQFGDGFAQRAQEAIKCRNAEAWLACCAMVGAAAESILLALAVAKTDDEPQVVKNYNASGGRRRVINMVVGQSDEATRNHLVTFSNIVTNWRDEAAHGHASSLANANADEALRQLLHMCQWVSREWAVLTS